MGMMDMGVKDFNEDIIISSYTNPVKIICLQKFHVLQYKRATCVNSKQGFVAILNFMVNEPKTQGAQMLLCNKPYHWPTEMKTQQLGVIMPNTYVFGAKL